MDENVLNFYLTKLEDILCRHQLDAILGNKYSAQAIFDEKFENHFNEDILKYGLALYCGLYGRDQWAEDYRKKAHKKLGVPSHQ